MGWHPHYVSRMEKKKKCTSTGCSLKRPFSWSSNKETEQGTDYSEAFESNKMNFFKNCQIFPLLIGEIHEDNINKKKLDYNENHHEFWQEK